MDERKMRKIAKHRTYLLLILLTAGLLPERSASYPIDGYDITGIRRLRYLEMVLQGELQGTLPVQGGRLSVQDIKLHLLGASGDSLTTFPAVNPELQQSINALFPNLHESYSLTVLDITPSHDVRYACRQEKKQFQPGSVGKLVVIAGLFKELENLYPESFNKRQELLKNKIVRGGKWALYDSHTVPIFDPDSRKFSRRTISENDVFSLYEWADHMLSASNNGAASVVWREVILMHVFGKDYASLTEERADEFFKSTPRNELMELAVQVVNQPLREAGITENDWRLGSMFTSEAKKIIPGSGGSSASPYGLMKYLVALESGKIVDVESSLEIKRLLYMTANRIRYSSSGSLTVAAVYFKSGSLYQCREEEGYNCQKYMGNVSNYMNSVIIVEHPEGPVYLVALMSNVLKKNSAADHNALASKIDRALRKVP
jgi:hypothetical protein